MNSFKLLVVFIPLLFGSFAQRFQRHLINGTKNGYINGNIEMDNLDALSSDGENAVKFVRNGEEAELELEDKELKFEFCSIGCMGKEVVACFDSADSDSLRQGDCDPGQWEFRAGVKKVDEKNYLWFTSSEINFKFTDPNGICAKATMAFPDASSTLTDKFPSCDPLKHDGNVVKLYILQAKRECPLYVLNAKKWTPPSTTAPQNTTELLETNQTNSNTSEANTALWIGIGIGIFILIIVVIGFGYCCYRTQIQKKPLFGKKKDVQQIAIIPEASKKANVVKEKTADEEQVLKAEPTKVVAKPEPPKEPTAAKEKPPKPAKENISKEKKAPIVEPKPSKEITQEDNPPPAKKVSVEPTVEDPTTEASIVPKAVVQQKQYHTGNPPRVYVPYKVILPEPKSVNAPKSGSLKTGKKDSLSGRHEIGMEGLVQSAPEQVKRHDINVGLLNDETKEKLEKFYPPGPVRSFDPREIEILRCARISVMFKTIEMLVDDAMKALKERGVTFDEKSNIIEMPPKAEKYLRSKKTPEFVRSFAFGNVFREFIDAQTRVNESFSIPLLWTIILQRRYPAVNRRKAFTWIRRELPIIEKEFTAEERSKLAYPICAIEAACKMNADGFKNVSLLDSLSGDDDDETQNSTTEKLRKKESA